MILVDADNYFSAKKNFYDYLPSGRSCNTVLQAAHDLHKMKGQSTNVGTLQSMEIKVKSTRWILY